MSLINKEELLAVIQSDIDLHITGMENVEPVMRCLQTILDDVKESPTVDAVPVGHGRWIPCSEKMPDFPKKSLWVNAKGEPCLPVGAKSQDEGPWSDGYIVCSDKGKVFYATWYAISKHHDPHFTTRAHVVAWIPMPKPYKAERKEE